MSPAGLAALVAMPIVGVALGRGFDARWLIAAGLLVMAFGNYWMSQMNLDISPGQVVVAAGDAGFRTLDVLCAGECGGLPLYPTVAARISRWFAQSAAQRGRQCRHLDGTDRSGAPRSISHLRLGESLDSFNANVVSFLDQARAVFLQQSGDPSGAQQLAWQTLENLRQLQASSLAYFDVFWLLAVVMLAPLLTVLLMKRSVAEKGAHIGQE